MVDIDDQMVELIKESIKLEISGKGFYERAAVVTEDELGKAMFIRLAKEEDGHLTVLEKIFTSITGGEDWRNIADREMQKKGPASVVDQLEAAIAKRGKDNKNANGAEALKIAMEMERKAIRFFEELVKKASNPKVRELAESLADEERFHYDLLQSQHDSVLNMGYWIDSTDIRMDSKF
ncbi:ferritin-like domain-containing protein [endosymbiont of Lamellibrachia barhami]|uniref:ferritin-like domain-containing protein n=1 Tax=endosymbiont of Lamellibrachia barhami TaxID=205975 RepID=UPI0015A77D11|nr:ferritin family protein [endosymbiont of Lamellibrachia barhami]